MVRLVQNMPSANNGEQYKDNNNNITKYLEFNKDTLLELAEKNYQNLVQPLRDNAIDAAATAAAYNSTFSLPLSSTFPSPFDQRYLHNR
jgi:hypothetical protein